MTFSCSSQHGRIAPGPTPITRLNGVSDGDVLEVVANVALNVLTNYVNTVARTQVDFPAVRPAKLAA